MGESWEYGCGYRIKANIVPMPRLSMHQFSAQMIGIETISNVHMVHSEMGKLHKIKWALTHGLCVL